MSVREQPSGPDPAQSGTLLHHVALVPDWERALEEGAYRMSTRGMSLESVGFVHLARPEQVDGVLNRFYADLDEVMVVTVRTDGLDVRHEPAAEGTGELYPHLYAELPLDRVVSARRMLRNGVIWRASATSA